MATNSFVSIADWIRNSALGWYGSRPQTVVPATARPSPATAPVPAPRPAPPPAPPSTLPFSLLSNLTPDLLKPPPAATDPNTPVEPFPSDTTSPAKIVSRGSGPAPFETLYHDFNLQALPFYNFWEQGEEMSEHERGNQKLEDVPRYIKLSWLPAPDIKDPDAFRKRQLAGRDPGARTTFTQLSPFGFGSHQVVGHANNGKLWLPPHLQPENFKQNALAIANGYVFAGMVESVVEVKTGSVAPPALPTSNVIDEDQYLAHSELTWGIPYSDFNHAIWRWKSRVYGAQQRMTGNRLSQGADLQRRSLVNGQYALAPQSQGVIDLRAVNSASPAISFYGFTAGTLDRNPQSLVFEIADQLGSAHLDDTIAELQSVKLKMLHTNLEGLMSQERLDTMTAPQHAEAVAAVAPFAANMAVYASAGMQAKLREISIPSFNAPDTIKPLEYVGYIIEKYELVDGSFKLVDTLFIPGRDYTQYYDTRVKYGVAYRYRVRSVVRWSRKRGVGVLGQDPTSIDAPGAGLNSLTPNDVSYFASEWGSEWAPAVLIDAVPPPPPHQFQVRTDSRNRFIEVSFVLPYNPQMDICKMTLWRKLQDQEGADLTDWIQVQEIDAQLRQGTRQLFINELQHRQDDITGTKFNITQADTIETVVEFAPVNSRFVDTDVGYFGEENSHRYVYAATCHTRHGETSVLSEQLAARLNPHWRQEGEFLLDFVSSAGVNMDFDTGLFSTRPERRLRSEIIFTPAQEQPGIITASGQSRLAQSPVQGASYVARIESLDTGQRVDVPIVLNVKNLPEENTVQSMTVLVPAQ